MGDKLTSSLEKAMDAQEKTSISKLSWAAQQAYTSRIDYVRKARERLRAKDYAVAMHYFHSYLSALAMYYDVETSSLGPELLKFNNAEQYEFIVVTFVYWELAKIYDRFPDDVGRTKYCLRQMVSFVKGHKIQKVMSSALSMYIRRKHCRHKEVFEDFNAIIRTGPVECYIATFCYGEGDSRLKFYREFRETLLNYKWGKIFVKYYYRYSPKLIKFCNHHRGLSFIFKKIATLILNFLLKVLKNVHS